MRFLVSVQPEKITEKDSWAPAGETVIPNFPATPDNVFLSTVSFKRSPYAEIVERDDIDIDKIADTLKKQYPGLPESLHENYVLATAKAAHTYPVGTKFNIFITQDTAKLKTIGKEQLYVLWEKQPL